MNVSRILGVAAGVCLLASVPATAASAAAPASHRHAVHASSTHKPVKAHDRLAGPRRAAQHVVSARARQVSRLQAASLASTVLNEPDRAALAVALQAASDSVGSDLAAIPAAASVRALNAVKRAAAVSTQIARAQYVTVTAADAVESDSAARSVTVTDLDAQVATAAAAGTDVTAAQAALLDAHAQLDAANTAAQGAVAGILGVAPTATHRALVLALTTAQQALAVADTAAAAADADIASAQAALGT